MEAILFLLVYSIFKAFLPLPSLEVVLIPLAIHNPSGILLYSFIGAIGTFIGGSFGYFLATLVDEKFWCKCFGEKTWQKGKQLIQKHGVFAVFIGGITPIPDFLLAYIAGFCRMNYLLFAFSDGFARLLRSILVLYIFNSLGIVIDMDKYGMYILYITIAYFLGKYFVNIIRSKVK